MLPCSLSGHSSTLAPRLHTEVVGEDSETSSSAVDTLPSDIMIDAFPHTSLNSLLYVVCDSRD